MHRWSEGLRRAIATAVRSTLLPLFFLLAVAACGGGSGDEALDEGVDQAAGTLGEAGGSAGSATSAMAAGDAAPSEPEGRQVLGERLTTRVITDPGQGGLPVGVVAVPDTWRFQSQVVWNYAHHSNPVTIATGAENPANAEAVFGYPAARFFYLRPHPGYYQQGQNAGGLVFLDGMSPEQAMVAFVRQARGGAPGLRFVGSKELPGLAAALQLPPAQNQRGLGMKITYELRGIPVEEEFYAVSYQVEIPYDGPQGRTWQINWGLDALHSFRAAAGTLDERRPVFAAIAKSFRPNPAWQQRLGAIHQVLAAEFNRQLQAGYDAIAAAGRLSQQISANNDAMLAAIDSQLRASQASSGAAARSANDRFSDYVRGVETVEDPYYGTSQHAHDQQFHWTDGYGTYRHSNDATYDPNHTEVGNWQLLRGVQ